MTSPEQFFPEDTSATKESRQQKRKRLAEERLQEGLLRRNAREIKESLSATLNPESYIGEADMNLFRGAGYSSDEIKWIAAVKRASSQDVTVNAKSERRWTKRVESYKPDISRMIGPNAYDLVRVHAMLAKDIKTFGHDMISQETEDYLDEMLSRIVVYYGDMGIRIMQGELKQTETAGLYETALINLFKKYKDCRDAKDKASLLSQWLNIIHYGGSREALSAFGGFPVPSDARGSEAFQKAQQDFLDRLNNLGSKL